MLVTILPFFLAAHVAVREDGERSGSDWQRHGPESTYDVLVNMSLANIVHEGDNFCSMISSELKCRPKGTDTLACRFANGRAVRPSPDDERCTNAKNFVPIGDRFVGGDPFEVRFGPGGIENLVVPRDIPRPRLDRIRAIVGQLNVGLVVEDRRGRFVTMENSSIGYCEVEVKMSRSGYGRGIGDDREGEYEFALELERGGRLLPLSRAGLTIDKVRRPKRCPHRRIYFFGNHEDFSFGHGNAFMDMTASNSHAYISRREMHSYTESTGVMRTPTKPRTMRLFERISLSLKSVQPARSSMPEIVGPASTSLYAYAGPNGIPG